MAESGKSGERRSEDGGRRGGGPPQEARCPAGGGPSPVAGTKRHLPRGIVIQLTGTEGEWDSLDDGELLDHDDDCPSVPLPKERQPSGEDERRLHSPSFHVPLSPSDPGSLGDGFLSPGPSSPRQRPLASLVKSLSTELELKESSTLRPRPIISLVKSISTEISRSEPEVSQSKSDSRLNLHVWKQLTQHKGRGNGDSRTAPPSPSSHSPTAEGPKGGFFKMELEDTKRKLSEAVHEPFSSMFSKILREEGAGSPRHQCRGPGAPQVGSRGSGHEGATDTVLSESPVRNARRAEADFLPVFNWPGRGQRGCCPVHHNRPHHGDEELDAGAEADAETRSQARTSPTGAEPVVRTFDLSQPPRPLPGMSLFCVAVLSYGYFILPLSPYLSGLALGLALGFLLGLLLIRMGSPTSRRSASPHGPARTPSGGGIPPAVDVGAEPDALKGWMNEVQDYDPETWHPAATHSVFAALQGSRLCLDSPRNNIGRRAAHDERPHEAAFVRSRCFQLAHSKVFLLPSVLARKRMWNPKYPVCIRLAGGSNSREDEGGGSEPSSSSERDPDPPATLYLFGRTGREKEEWFRHFLFASMDGEGEAGRSGEPAAAPGGAVPSGRVGSSEDDADDAPPTSPVACVPPAPVSQSSGGAGGLSPPDYPSYMARLLAAEEGPPPRSPAAGGTESSPTLKGKCTCDPAERAGPSQAAWANALIGRVFWDFLREKRWSDAVSHKIQKKLSKIRLPYFMNELTLTELDMGCSMPQITAASTPQVNHRGLWVELQLVYAGGLQMTLQTKFNLSKLGKDGGQDADCTTEAASHRPVFGVLADSDEESSSAGSSDEEELLPTARTHYFQKAAENEFIKKKFEEMSNTPLLLTVEVQELSGTLVVNIPPPPSDRIWYSFCVPPKLDLHVRPKLGEREVTFCHVTEWIEKKLQDEFQKVFVLPNMDDICVPLMRSVVDGPRPAARPKPPRSSSSESIQGIPPEAHESD
uniref:Testis expressed 2, like n=1 Tax=Gasterosteus aculeatus aculeatus TaxID=481459 RepID=A0AAQ4QTE1_GASAC